MRRNASNAVGSAERGSPYSISVKRTRRGVQKTRSDRAV
jgi:hypothetical protein